MNRAFAENTTIMYRTVHPYNNKKRATGYRHGSDRDGYARILEAAGDKFEQRVFQNGNGVSHLVNLFHVCSLDKRAEAVFFL